MQTTHDHFTPAKQHKDLVLVCDHITSPANQGALFRLADAFGVRKLIFLGTVLDLTSSRLKKTARSSQDHIRYLDEQDGTAILAHYKKEGYQCIALEITKTSVPITALAPTSPKMLLLIGNEQDGIAAPLLQLVNNVTHIPMYGRNSSMNVAQAAAIGLFQLCK